MRINNKLRLSNIFPQINDYFELNDTTDIIISIIFYLFIVYQIGYQLGRFYSHMIH
ncbi:MAG: hypothetical protein ACOCRZ_05510 [Halothermotrichaceae bacterium]